MFALCVVAKNQTRVLIIHVYLHLTEIIQVYDLGINSSRERISF